MGLWGLLFGSVVGRGFLLPVKQAWWWGWSRRRRGCQFGWDETTKGDGWDTPESLDTANSR